MKHIILPQAVRRILPPPWKSIYLYVENVFSALNHRFAGGIPKKNAVIDGDVTKGSLMAGQSARLVGEVKPLKCIVDEMIDDAESELKRLQRIFIAESA